MVRWYPTDLVRILRDRYPPEKVHSLVIITKFPGALLEDPLLATLARYEQVMVQVTVTGLGGSDLEPRVPPAEQVLSKLPALLDLVGRPERLIVRIDPIVHWRERPGGPLHSNLPLFGDITRAVRDAGVRTVKSSLTTPYPKALRRFARAGKELVNPSGSFREEILREMEARAVSCGVRLEFCCEPTRESTACINGRLLTRLHPRGLPAREDRPKGQRRACGCTHAIDLAWYATHPCSSGCLYCYANPIDRPPRRTAAGPRSPATRAEAANPPEAIEAAAQGQPRHLIDPHVHLMTPGRTASGIRWIRRVVPQYRDLPEDTPSERLLEHLRAAGVELVFNHFYPLHGGESEAINRWQAELASRHPDVVAFASVHAEDDDPARVVSSAFEDLDLAGLKLHPYVQGLDPLDSRLRPALDLVEESGRPLFLHTGFSEFYGARSLVEAVEELARSHPRLRLVVAHLLYPDLPLGAWPERLERHPNLYLDATNVLSLVRPGTPEGDDFAALLTRWSRRTLFGSDYPMGMDYPVSRLYPLAQDLAPDQDSLEDVSWRTAACLVESRRLPPDIARDLD